MTAVRVSANTQMEHSCNWRCCFGCKDAVDDDHKKINAEVPAPETAQKTIKVFHELRRVEEGKESTQGALEYEFDAVHFKMKKTPDQTPEHTPRKEKENVD